MFEQFTLGIEEEFQIVDPETRELKSHVSEILDEGKLLLGEKIKPEVGWYWGAVENVVWEGHDADVDLQPGRATITLIADSYLHRWRWR